MSAVQVHAVIGDGDDVRTTGGGRGGRFFGGGCFLLSDDLDWGRQVYRTQALPWLNGQEPEHGAP